MLERILDGRTDLVFDYLAEGHPATSSDRRGTRLISWCAYHGDVSAIRYLLAHGESLSSIGANLRPRRRAPPGARSQPQRRHQPFRRDGRVHARL